jgi:hypothetical protein
LGSLSEPGFFNGSLWRFIELQQRHPGTQRIAARPLRRETRRPQAGDLPISMD